MHPHTANVAKEPYISVTKEMLPTNGLDCTTCTLIPRMLQKSPIYIYRNKRDVADQRAVSHYMHTHTAIYVSHTHPCDTTHYMHAHTANVVKEPYVPLTKEPDIHDKRALHT